MRDVIIVLLVFSSLPIILVRPYVGILVWSWLGYMNPHRLAWGFAYDFPFAQIVGLVTIIATVFSSERKRIPFTGLVVVWLFFVLWMNVTTIVSLVPDLAWAEWDRTMKIQLFTLLTIMLMRDPQRIGYLIWVIVGSIGFFGVKGGIFSLLTGGSHRVFGPAGSFIEDNNAMGLAMVMVLPLMWYLYLRLERKLWRNAMLAAIGLTALAIFTTHSRGAFLAIAAMTLFLLLKSRRKLQLASALVVLLPMMWFFMPQAWHDRMATITEYQQDGSAMGRINAWMFAINLANDRPLVGGGFQTFMPNLFQRYAPEPDDFHDSHSIYFETLGEHGYVGLVLFLMLGTGAMLTCGRVRKYARAHAELVWAADLAAMIQVSLVGYAVGGLFLGLAYFDLYYHLIAITILLQALAKDHSIESASQLALKRSAAPTLSSRRVHEANLPDRRHLV